MHQIMRQDVSLIHTCVNLQVHPEVAGITEGLAAVLTLMGLHPNVTHEVHVKLCGRDKGARAHAALELLLAPVTQTFRPSVCIVAGVWIHATSDAVVTVVFVRRHRAVGVAGPR